MRRTFLIAVSSAALALPASISTGHATVATTVAIARDGISVSQTYPMPARGKVAIVGHGYGHGHGMSQYGAEGAARQGLGWREIVGFYYPGTEVARDKGRIAVLISADTSPDVVVEHRSRLRVTKESTGVVHEVPDRGDGLWRLVPAKDPSRTKVQFHDGGWKRWMAFDGSVSFSAAGRPVRLRLGSSTQAYRGRLISAIPTPGSTDRDTVNSVDLDTYVRGVVPAEMPATWTPAAVQAQAVAARTYGAYEKAHPRAGHYQICDTTACQVYRGVSGEHPSADAAVRETRGRILTHQDEPAFTQFSSSSGGWTSANQFPYLPAKKDPYDGWSGNPNHTWRTSVDVSRIERAWPAIGNLRSIKVTRRDGNGQWKGRIESLTLVGGKRNVTISGDSLRFALGLKSTWLTFKP
ncbi:SpoIID/LytB domain-containing protein [Nocardioides sp. JQ2195]|uniref:SpoIID/LytB domain-containing protein n=1 Tax=Nocardioides sp. JQ2195 TaxID=2592334 RepID=UPI00143E7EBD|nr:SpoIID/LytB domain-containing protein [Nocardioides sp. JQ2195]QIX25906.1 SpoIID/LytB domain-containing protein [Nocardioides sp. JQ2195]